MPVHKRDVARALEEIGRYLEIEEGNRFRSRAYINAARQIDALQVPIEEFVRSGEMLRTPGIGKTTGQVIEEIVRTGSSRYLEELRGKYPRGIFELLRVPGLGLRKIGVLHKELGIGSVDELDAAVQANKLVALRGFGPKTQQRIAESIQFLRAHQTRYLLPAALRFAEMLCEHFDDVTVVQEVAISGSIRRRLEVIGNINLCMAAIDPGAAAEAIGSADFLEAAEQIDSTTLRAQSRVAMPVLFHLCRPEELATTLLFTTGSAAFVDAAVSRARSKGMELTPAGIWKRGKRLDVESEDDVFRAMGAAPIAPELREEAPKAFGARKRRLVQVSDLRGVFHVHSTYSDGRATIFEMLEAAASRGLSYVGLSDHSPTAYYARGLTADQLALQHAEIEKNRPAFPSLRIFKGTESDILQNGELDYPPEILAKFEFVIASVHSRFKMSRDEMTERILRAVENPFTTFLGHPTGRLLLARDGYMLDFDRLFAAAAKHGVIIEINGNPRRLDLDWRLMQRALDHGLRFVISPDAHSIAEMSHIVSGTWAARKGGLAPQQVFNTLPVADVERYLTKRRQAAIALSS